MFLGILVVDIVAKFATKFGTIPKLQDITLTQFINLQERLMSPNTDPVRLRPEFSTVQSVKER